MDITKRTLNIMKKSGWYEGRTIDISEMVAFLEKSGYHVFQAARDFLKEFGGLTIKVPRTGLISRKEDTHIIDPIATVGDYYTYGSFEEEEVNYGEKLLPVGDIDDNNLVLLISETGKFYCETRKLGDTAWEVLNNLCSRE